VSSASPDISFDLPARLRAARDAACLSQKELAAKLDVPLRTLQSWEAGTFPQPRHRRALLTFITETERSAA
jgi:DNA-binding transcriptional regulator YiaG